MKKNTFLLWLLAISVLACKKDDKTYTGPTLIEFTKSSVSTVVEFSQTGESSIKIPLQIVGVAGSWDRKILLELSGEDARFKLKSTQVTLKANEYTTEAELVIAGGNFAEGDDATVDITISSSSDISPSENYKTCSVSISKQSFLDIFVGTFVCEEDANQDTYYTTFIAGLAENTIKNTNFWNFAPQGQYVTYTILEDTAMSVVINEQEWTDKAGNTYTVTGSGTYDYSGNMTVDYTLTIEDTVYETGTHIFTPVN